MAKVAWTQPSDIRDRWIGDLPAGVEDNYLLTAIEDVEDQLIILVPELVDQFDDVIPLSRVKRVVSRVVIRHLRNPDGVRSLSEATGPVTASVTYSGDDPGALVVTSEDIEVLQGRPAAKGAWAHSMIPARSYLAVKSLEPDVWRTTY